MHEDVIELTGQEKGSTSMILVGMHGNEKCGIDVIEEILPTLKVQKGRVLIAYGNPKAIQENIRYIEANLNRMFKPESDLSVAEKSSYEYSRAQFLKKYLNQSDILLDIHASLTPESKRFVICEDNGRDIAKYLPVSLVVSGFDLAEPGGTDYYMNQNGKVGICIECGFSNDQSSTEIARKAIQSFLIKQGNIAGDLQISSQVEVEIEGLYSSKTDNFRLIREFKDFEDVAFGQTIGVDGDTKVKMPIDGIILFARNRDKINEEAFLFGRYKNKA